MSFARFCRLNTARAFTVGGLGCNWNSLMMNNAESSRKLWLIFFGCLAAVLLFSFLGARLLSRRTYMSVARIDVHGSIKMSVGYDPNPIRTEFDRIGSDTVLTQVISELRRWPDFAEHTKISGETGYPEALRKLRKHIDLRQSRSTSLIEIRAYSSHPQVAADIANKVAEVYMRYRNTNGVNVQLVDRAVPVSR